MNIQLINSVNNFYGNIKICGSKSESNRLLILKAMFPKIKLNNISNSDDTKTIITALKSNEKKIDIHHAGTAMRFLTAYFAFQSKKEVFLTGSKRMKERPIKILVEALREMGALISYHENDGFPPLLIRSSRPSKNYIKLSSSLSSQYVSALMLIAPKIPNGLFIEMSGRMTSMSYIKMTQSILENIGVNVKFNKKKISITNKLNIDSKTVKVESDWSSASYFFSIVALSKDSNIRLSSFKKTSLQGDSNLINIYKELGVSSKFEDDTLILKKQTNFTFPNHIKLDLIDSPDIAQTIAVTCFGLGISCDLFGLHTLKIKETDRLYALKKELIKLGADAYSTENSFHLKSSKNINQNIMISTYEDHRMAMAFAPLSIKTPLEIENPDVVNKSYPNFWNDLYSIGFQCVKK